MDVSFRNILAECGDKLLSIPQCMRSQGYWEGEQFKSNADKIAHSFLIKELSKAYDLPIVSEEDNKIDNNQYPKYIIIDPIDGTRSYSEGFSGWVSQVALIQNSQVISSCIYAPETQEYFSAIRGEGAWHNDRRIKIKLSENSNINSIIDNSPVPSGFVKSLINDFKIPTYIESGSIGLKICRVADSTVDLFFKDMNPRDWDLAAPKLILSEAGGTLKDLDGKEIFFGQPGLTHNGLIAGKSESVVERVLSYTSSHST